MSETTPEPHAAPPATGRPAEALTAGSGLSLPERRPCSTAEEDEPPGGDPPCWAHLFEDDPDHTGR